MAVESPEGFASNIVFPNNFPFPSFIRRISLSTSNSVWLPLSSRKLEALNYFLMLHVKHHRKVALGSFIQDKITRLGIINNQFVYNKKYNRIHAKN